MSGTLLVLTVVLSLPSSLRHALDQYDSGDFQPACEALEILRTEPSFDTEAQLKTLKFLGACRFILGIEGGAKQAWRELAEADDRAQLDPVQFPPEMITTFKTVKSTVAREKASAAALALAVPDPIEPTPPTIVDAAPKKSRARAFAPFGLGQFQNGHDSKGYLIAALHGATLAAGVGGLLLFEGEKTSGGFLQGGDFKDPDKAETLQTIYVAGFIGFAAIWAYGIFDALGHFDTPVAILPYEGGAMIGSGFQW